MEPLKLPSPPAATPVALAQPPPAAADLGIQLRRLAILSAVLILTFAKPLLALVRFSLHSELYSHLLLIPFVSVYLAWLKKQELQPCPEPECKLALLPFGAGLLLLIGYLSAPRFGLSLAPADSLAWITVSFVVFFIAAAVFSLGRRNVQALAFPLAFLLLFVPFPVGVEKAIEFFLQHRSADAAELFFSVVGTPLHRQGVLFQLPGFSLQVAPECSGIRSTLVLFIASLVAGQLFLRSNWKRALFALVVIPLGIFRNAFRIVVLGELCVHVNPAFIDSPIHHRGGPIFFLLSMVPFLLLLYYLRKTDGPKQKG